MSMFDNYENLSPSYIPNNQKVEIQNRIEFNNKEPKKEFSKSGEFIGYSWYYGDTVQIPYNVNKKVLVEKDAIVYTEPGEAPTSETIGVYGQKAYNVSDLKLWVCLTLDQDIYTWAPQKKFSYPKHGEKEVTLNSGIDMSDKTIEVTISNFRKEIVYSEKFEHCYSVLVDIDRELSDKLIKGLYYMTFSIVDDTSHYSDESLLILVKAADKSYDIFSEDGSFIVTEESLEEYIERIVRSFIDSDFSQYSTNALWNSTITEKIFGENGIDYNIDQLRSDIDDISSYIPNDVSISNKLASKRYVDEAISHVGPTVTRTSELENDGEDGSNPFITEQALEDYATKEYVEEGLSGKANIEDIPSLDDYATKEYVNSGLETKADISDIPDLTDYATKEYVNAGLSEKADIEDIPSLDGYATENWVDENAVMSEDTDLTDIVTSVDAIQNINSDDKVITPKGVKTYVDSVIGDVSLALATLDEIIGGNS